MNIATATCLGCAARVAPADRFCESCGASLSAIGRAAIPRTGRLPEPDRDELRVAEVALITDRGHQHDCNEDAAAAGFVADREGQPPRAIAVAVCDGVSTSSGARTAAAAASTAGVDAMLGALAASRRLRSVMVAGLAAAAKAASAAQTDPSTAPSCTYAAAAVDNSVVPARVVVGSVGDSRVYWLPTPPGQPERLTIDDSVAQELITAGAADDSDAVLAGAHTLTRWLGADSEPQPWSGSSLRAVTVSGPGLLMLCTDGLWNYLSEAEDIARLITGLDAMSAARALVDYALQAGGHDNITVALIPIGAPHDFN